MNEFKVVFIFLWTQQYLLGQLDASASHGGLFHDDQIPVGDYKRPLADVETDEAKVETVDSDIPDLASVYESLKKVPAVDARDNEGDLSKEPKMACFDLLLKTLPLGHQADVKKCVERLQTEVDYSVVLDSHRADAKGMGSSSNIAELSERVAGAQRLKPNYARSAIKPQQCPPCNCDPLLVTVMEESLLDANVPTTLDATETSLNADQNMKTLSRKRRSYGTGYTAANSGSTSNVGNWVSRRVPMLYPSRTMYQGSVPQPKLPTTPVTPNRVGSVTQKNRFFGPNADFNTLVPLSPFGPQIRGHHPTTTTTSTFNRRVPVFADFSKDGYWHDMGPPDPELMFFNRGYSEKVNLMNQIRSSSLSPLHSGAVYIGDVAESAHPNDRIFGLDADFNFPHDMHAFNFKPYGPRMDFEEWKANEFPVYSHSIFELTDSLVGFNVPMIRDDPVSEHVLEPGYYRLESFSKSGNATLMSLKNGIPYEVPNLLASPVDFAKLKAIAPWEDPLGKYFPAGYGWFVLGSPLGLSNPKTGSHYAYFKELPESSDFGSPLFNPLNALDTIDYDESYFECLVTVSEDGVVSCQ